MIMTRWIMYLIWRFVPDVRMSMGERALNGCGEEALCYYSAQSMSIVHHLLTTILSEQDVTQTHHTPPPIQPHPQEIKLPKPRWHRHCRGIVILTASTSKTWCPLRLGKLLQSTFASLFLSCCLLGGMLSFDGGTGGVQWKPSQLKSHHSCSI